MTANTASDFFNQTPRIKVIANGLFGSGKTTFGMTFPRVYYVGTEPGGLEILRAPDAINIRKNLAYYELCYLDPLAGKDDIKTLVEEVNAPVVCNRGVVKEGLIYQACKRAAEAHKKGECDTLFLDNLTYLSELFWDYIDRYLRQEFLTEKGNLDRLKMYGYLDRWLFRFMMANIVAFPGNVVVSCHLKSEGKEKLEKKKDKQVEVVPNILGGFRDKAEGMFTASIYLDRKMVIITDKEGKQRQISKFIAYTQPCIALGSKILAKNRHGLPNPMENITYSSIMEVINQSTNTKETSNG